MQQERTRHFDFSKRNIQFPFLIYRAKTIHEDSRSQPDKGLITLWWWPSSLPGTLSVSLPVFACKPFSEAVSTAVMQYSGSSSRLFVLIRELPVEMFAERKHLPPRLLKHAQHLYTPNLWPHADVLLVLSYLIRPIVVTARLEGWHFDTRRNFIVLYISLEMNPDDLLQQKS